jgi:transcriptional regulator with XRE-family HTH domain/tetratricopeptide (TPR) repeat protein
MAQTHVEPTTYKERSNMVNARIAARLTQKQVAKKMEVGLRSIINWEKAHRTPHLSQLEGLREAIEFTGTDEELLQVFLVEKPVEDPDQGNICQESKHSHQLTTTCQREANRDILESASPQPIVIYIQGFDKELSSMDKVRREIAIAIGTTLVGANLQILTAPLIASEGHTGATVPPEESLPLCTFIIESCWEYLNQANYSKVERGVQKTLPTLRRTANTRGPYQSTAANLAVQADIMQIVLATHNADFVGREFYCGDAVHFGRLSGNRGLLALALDWQANTYTVCCREPQTAIPILNNALSSLDNEMLRAGKDIQQRERSREYPPSLVRSAIYSDLSIAYAQEGDEIEAMKYVELAYSAMPDYPELDPIYRCAQWNHQALNVLVGNASLHLAEKLHNDEYAQQANKAYEQAAILQTANPSVKCMMFIRQADAARLLDEMNHFIRCLTEGLEIGVKSNSIRSITEASDVMGHIPSKWQRETAIQKLQKEITHAIAARR